MADLPRQFPGGKFRAPGRTVPWRAGTHDANSRHRNVGATTGRRG